MVFLTYYDIRDTISSSLPDNSPSNIHSPLAFYIGSGGSAAHSHRHQFRVHVSFVLPSNSLIFGSRSLYVMYCVLSNAFSFSSSVSSRPDKVASFNFCSFSAGLKLYLFHLNDLDSSSVSNSKPRVSRPCSI